MPPPRRVMWFGVWGHDVPADPPVWCGVVFPAIGRGWGFGSAWGASPLWFGVGRGLGLIGEFGIIIIIVNMIIMIIMINDHVVFFCLLILCQGRDLGDSWVNCRRDRACPGRDPGHTCLFRTLM